MTLAAGTALTLAVYLLVADGLAALVLGGLLSLPATLVVALAIVGSWWQEGLRRRLAVVPRLDAALVALAGLGVVVEIVMLAPGMLDAFTHLLLFLVLVKLYTRRGTRDARDIAFLAFFMLVAVSSATTSVVFLGLFIVFLAVGTWLLVVRQFMQESQNFQMRVGREILGLSLAASAATIVITAGLFLVIPRIGQAALPVRTQGPRMVTGFSDRVELGAFGDIETDSAVVMRVHIKDVYGEPVRPETVPGLRWRGVALDAFDGRSWTVSRSTLRLTLRRHEPVPFAVHQYYGGPVLTQEIYLEPLGTEMIFGAPRVLRLHGRSDFVTIDDLGNILIPSAAARLNYTVESEPEIGDPRRADVADARVPPDPRWIARYTQLPPLAPRVVDLARELTAGSTDRYDAAVRLTMWLSRNLRYSLALKRTTDLPPVEEFLFVQRAGNCEYFASALAVMLRSLGIPARVVNGFQRGEWNPYGDYFMVRLRDAHTWVEVFINGAGWVSLDPSPRDAGDARTLAEDASLWLDHLRLSWYRYVVSWNLHDQLAAAEGVRRVTWSWGTAVVQAPEWRTPSRLALVAATGALVALLLNVRRRASGAAVAGPMPRFYARALRALARRDLTPAAGETAREFAARVAAAGSPFVALTGAYERVRFGGAVLTAAETAEMEACVTAVENARA